VTEKHLTLLVVPHDERNVRRVRLSYRGLKIAALLSMFVVVVGLAAIVSYGSVVSRATRAALLERENGRLREENRKVDLLAENLERTERAYRQIREMAGLPPPESTPDGTRDAGRGVRTREGEGATTEPLGPLALAASSENPVSEKPTPGSGSTDTGRPSGWPLTVEGFVTAGYTGAEGHPGVDIAVPRNTPVVATAAGLVKSVGFDSLYGRFVVLEHAGDLETMYAHNEVLLVEAGTRVERGETIAYSGSSGRSSAPHLHYEVRRGGAPLDPRAYLP